mmetsp:Transcript_25323/g.46234  ORF Transcript_25323/g.46234 Transcript_25323/m.46234 type:complete len:109 (+) Transcript_25323:347-673(+)
MLAGLVDGLEGRNIPGTGALLLPGMLLAGTEYDLTGPEPLRQTRDGAGLTDDVPAAKCFGDRLYGIVLGAMLELEDEAPTGAARDRDCIGDARETLCIAALALAVSRP